MALCDSEPSQEDEAGLEGLKAALRSSAGVKPPLALFLALLRLRCAPDIDARWLATRIALASDVATLRERSFLERECSDAGLDKVLQMVHDAKRVKRPRLEDIPRATLPGPHSAGQTRRETKGMQPCERNVQLCNSVIWKRSMKYYVNSGLQAWSGNDVPFGISSSTFAAEWYLGVVKAFAKHLRDGALADSKPPERVYVLDLGAGHGLFALRMAIIAAEQVDAGQWNGLPDPCLVMTDFHTKVLEPYLHTRRFQHLVARRFLDVAKLDLCEIAGAQPSCSTIALEHGTQVSTKADPIVAIANYCIDSLPADLYKRNEELYQALVTTWTTSRSNSVPNVDGIGVQWEPVQEPLLATEMKIPLSSLEEGCQVLFPTTGVKALRTLFRQEEGDRKFPAILILGDKMSDTRSDPMAWKSGIPGLDRHGASGCVSCAVDPYAFAEGLDVSSENACFTNERFDQDYGIAVYVVQPKVEHVDAAGKKAPLSGKNALINQVRNACYTGPCVSDVDIIRTWITTNLTLLHKVMSQVHTAIATFEFTAFDFEFFLSIMWKIPAHVAKQGPVLRAAMRCFHRRPPAALASKNAELLFARWLYVAGHQTQLLEVLQLIMPSPAVEKLRSKVAP